LLHPLLPDPCAQAFDEAGGGGDADVGADEELLQFLPELVVDARAFKKPRYPPEPGAAGAVEGVVGLVFRLWGAREPFEQI